MVSARYVVTAVGCLSTASQPRFPGADAFQGLSLHTGNWPREPVDFTGRREQMAASGARPLHELGPAEARGLMTAMRGEETPEPDMASVHDTRVRASGGFVPVRVLTPVERPRGVIVYYHGGGWVIGGLADFD